MRDRKFSIGKEAAIELYNSKWWEGRTEREICDVQLFIHELCMPFSIFHRALEKVLGRPVWTHEFGFCQEALLDEYLGNRPAPTFEEILEPFLKRHNVIFIEGKPD